MLAFFFIYSFLAYTLLAASKKQQVSKQPFTASLPLLLQYMSITSHRWSGGQCAYDEKTKIKIESHRR